MENNTTTKFLAVVFFCLGVFIMVNEEKIIIFKKMIKLILNLYQTNDIINLYKNTPV